MHTLKGVMNKQLNKKKIGKIGYKRGEMTNHHRLFNTVGPLPMHSLLIKQFSTIIMNINMICTGLKA